MYNKITGTETTEEAKKTHTKLKGKNLTPTAYSGIILELLFDGEEVQRNMNPLICLGKVLPPQRKDPREVAKRPQMTALENSSRDWKRAVSHLTEVSGCVKMSHPRDRRQDQVPHLCKNLLGRPRPCTTVRRRIGCSCMRSSL